MERTRAKLMLGALAMALATPIGAAPGGEAPLPPPRPADLTPAAPPKPAPDEPAPEPPLQMGPEGAAAACLTKLIAAGARAEAATAPASTIEGCGIASPVRLSSVMVAGGDVVGLPDQPILDCEFALRFADYVRLIVAPLGEALLRAKVASVETGPGYDCRSRDRLEGAKISAHAKGFAVDFVAVQFADKRRVVVERQASADEVSYFRAADCGLRLVHDRAGAGRRRLSRQPHASRH